MNMPEIGVLMTSEETCLCFRGQRIGLGHGCHWTWYKSSHYFSYLV